MTYERGRQWQRCKDEDNEDKRRQTERERKHSAPPQAKNDSGYERREIEDVVANPRGTCRTTMSRAPTPPHRLLLRQRTLSAERCRRVVDENLREDK
ncbi:hypothetical protein BGY98DRAFT_1049114 [Russula aff. rugulosa BPL654]|nr:hypothetical protein BGY98DRAFT_1049114 [Russula aff. rugulosa BPL654]